ncbi:MAG: hypothetical protein Q8N51_12990, partial [Gammaproteobacteria bacterium]|nr:hypothetical protein [Gammaproteobacteria bacterium]
GLQALVTTLQGGQEETASESVNCYRRHLYLAGDERRESLGPDGSPVRGALAQESVARVLGAGGKLPAQEYVRLRVRYFCDGAVFGGGGFVNGVFHRYRERFGPRRTSGARRLRGLMDPGLYVMRDLRVRVFG